MPEVRRGSSHTSRPTDDKLATTTLTSPDSSLAAVPTSQSNEHVTFQDDTPTSPRPVRHGSEPATATTAASAMLPPRRSLNYSQRPTADAYYDSRAATREEWKRRAKTLEEYYEDNPQLLPQLPFTWHHGWRRWRLFFFAFLVFVDASAVPIALYYGMNYAGNVEGWIIFAVVTTIWGGPTYLEFGLRTLRLIKKERFYRPLGTDSRWCFDMTTWTSVITITAVTALFVVGSAPHIVLLRVLCMPAPAILYCIGGVLLVVNFYHYMKWPAPFRISSTAKGEPVSFTHSRHIHHNQKLTTPGPARCILLHRRRRRRQCQSRTTIPRSPRRPLQSQPPLQTNAQLPIMVLGHSIHHPRHSPYCHCGDRPSSRDGCIRCMLGCSVSLDCPLGSHFGAHV